MTNYEKLIEVQRRKLRKALQHSEAELDYYFKRLRQECPKLLAIKLD